MSFAPGPSRNSTPRIIQGTRPGILDPTQSARILRDGLAALSFAAFDPLAASGGGLRKRAYDPESARPKRIVIESYPGRTTSKWRFVPNARRAPGVEDEGAWPRKVVLCGEQFILSEDQWDIYKLDPAYDCFIPPPPGAPIITRREPPFQAPSSSRTSSTSEHFKKRRFPSPDADAEDRSNGINKKFRTVVSLVTEDESDETEETTESDEEDEVEEIVIDEFEHVRYASSQERLKQHRKAREQQTKERREKLKRKTASSFESNRSPTPEIVDLTMEDYTSPECTSPRGTPPAAPPKRKVFTGGESPDETSPSQHHQPNKRARTQSPTSTRADLSKKRVDRSRHRRAQLKERMNGLKAQREQQLWEAIFADTPMGTPPPYSSQPHGTSQSHAARDHHAQDDNANTQPTEDDDAEHQAAIEESRRKLAELERDRPLWEQEACKRAMKEQAEEEARRLRKEEEHRRAQEAAAKEERRRRSAEAAAAEVEQRAQADKARIERERAQQRRRDRERWSYGPWTTIRAIERYKLLSEAFDTVKFTLENPVDFDVVPWPVLKSPVTLQLEDVDWSAVEGFFEAARRHMRTQDYKIFVEKSHKRFHPDRWRARGVLKSIADDELRGYLEVAATTVAQALTPIWREMRG